MTVFARQSARCACRPGRRALMPRLPSPSPLLPLPLPSRSSGPQWAGRFLPAGQGAGGNTGVGKAAGCECGARPQPWGGQPSHRSDGPHGRPARRSYSSHRSATRRARAPAGAAGSFWAARYGALPARPTPALAAGALRRGQGRAMPGPGAPPRRSARHRGRKQGRGHVHAPISTSDATAGPVRRGRQ